MMAAASPSGAECTAVSGPQRLALVELYTSERCSSCPPADRWLSALRKDKGLTERIVPLAFHVDYWNKLGWIDPYAQPAFSERQSIQSRRRGASFVFTPQILVSGRDYRRGIVFDDFDRRVKAINDSKPGASIRFEAARMPSGWAVALTSQLAGEVPPHAAQAFIAAYENVPANTITAGENRGLTLSHAYVVRNLAGPFAFDDSGKLSVKETLSVTARPRSDGFGLAAFVQDARSGDVYQAASSLCN